jgi:hypothetical protein
MRCATFRNLAAIVQATSLTTEPMKDWVLEPTGQLLLIALSPENST